MSAWQPPEAFDEYRVVRLLGEGAMGVVYLARDTVLDRSVAIKFLPAVEDEPMLHARFLVEGRAIARLQHPNVVAIYRVGSVDGRPYLVSEFAHGETLKDMRKPIPWSEALRIGLGLCRGLAAAHRRGVLHRDIKPANAILTDDGEAKLVDFGLAKLLDTAVGEMLPAAAHPARARASLSEASSSESTILAISPDDAAARTVVTAPPAAALEDETASMSPRTGEAAPPPEVTPSGALTRTGAIVGTPLYMAPEVWLSKPSTRASDVYSLGAVLYELCTGRPPHRGRTLAELAYLVQTDDPPSVADLVPDIDPRFAAAIHRCLRRDAALRFASADELRETLEAIADPGRVGTRAPANPYRGLEAFEAEHRAFFFGRERELAALLDRVRAQSLVVVAGDSGVGKSSLCRAGVLPEILEGALRDGRKYLALTLVPGRRPLETLSAMLATETGSPTASATEVDPAEAIARRLREYCRPGHGVILFIDQLEELVTVASQADAEAFASLLDTLEVTAPGVRVLATVRADFLSRLSPLGHLGEGLSRAVHILGPLAPWETREAIVGPARLLGVRFDPPELIDQLLDAYAKSEGGLPLLQFALAELWEARDRDRGVIPFEALARIGGLDGALSRHADGVVAKLLPAERAAARRMLSALVTPESTRRPRRESELEASPEAKVARDALVRGRLVLARESEGETSFELAHDALIRSWGTLRAWLDEDGERQAAQERLAAAAASWERLGRPDDALWARSQLDEMRRLGIQSREAESGFLAASARAVLRRRFVRAGLALALPVLVFAIYAVVRGVDKRQREAELTAHLADARTRLDGLRQKNVWLVDRRRQALAAFDASAADAETRWQDVLREDETEWREYASLGQSLDLMFLDHPRHPDVRRELAAVTFDRILLAEADHRDIERKELVSRLELFDGNGEVRKRLQEPARIQLRIAPHDARVKLLRYEQHDQRLVAVEVGMVHEEELSLAPGSYLLLAESAGRAPVRMPVLLRRGEHRTLSVELPDARAVPEGFVFIPAGSFLYGSAEEGDIRRFLESEPMHEVQTAAYLIGQHEVTYAEWLAHVEALPAAQRQHMTPLAKVVRGELRLDRSSGLWRVAMRPAAVLLEAREGTPIVYPGRQKLRSHDWRRMPVGGITLDMARRYAAWLAKSGKVPGARLCSEHEWERAARGADDRTFPHGYQLTPADGNHDASYDFKPDAMGPDEVGSHPASRSPFGLDDMAGNVYEWVDVKGKSMVRGGAYYYNAFTARVDNRGTADPSMAEVTVGTRICASFSPR